MNKIASLLCMFSLAGLPCTAQHRTSTLPDAPAPSIPVAGPALYSPPIQSERSKNYFLSTFGPDPIVEAAIRGGIQQKRDNPSEWPQGGQGYADRFGSAMGEIAVRGPTEYVLSDLFKEDLRVIPCGCSHSKLKLALADTVTSRRGEDGHRSLSIARMVGPVSGSMVAYKPGIPPAHAGMKSHPKSVSTTASYFSEILSTNRRTTSRHLPTEEMRCCK